MSASIGIITSYAVAYAVLHSLLASQTAKDWSQQMFGGIAGRWYRLAYNIVSVLLLVPFALMLRWLPDRLLYTMPAPWWGLALLGQAGALVGITYGVWQTGIWYFLGLRQLRASPAATAPEGAPRLVVQGLYRFVRHPLYFFSLILLWLTPQMTVNRLALVVVFSLYLYIGTFFEERRLVREFGAPYRLYQQQVPRLIPRLRKLPRPKTT